MSGPAHDWLVKRAVKWLLGTGNCKFALAEPWCEPWDGNSREHPDAIGWMRNGWSILIECKASRGDFTADKRKPARRLEAKTGFHMGQERYYLTPPHMVLPADLPDGWGLLEAHKRIVKVVVPCPRRQIAYDPELRTRVYTKIDQDIRTAEWGVLLTAMRQAAAVRMIKGGYFVPEDPDERERWERERERLLDGSAVGAQQRRASEEPRQEGGR